jgi:hypothetical protein
MKRTTLRTCLAIVAATMFSAACSPSTARPSPIVDVGRVDLTGSAGIAWARTGGLVVSFGLDPSDPATPIHLFRMDVDGRNRTDLDLPQLAGCQRTDYLRPERLPDGRIGAVRQCIPAAQTGGDWPTFLVGIDPTTTAVEELTPNLSTGTVVRIDGYAWTPDLKQAVVAEGSRVCQTLFVADSRGLTPLDLVVADDHGSFNIREMAELAGDDCGATGQADSPTRSPDGKTLMFAASTAAKSHSGTERLDAALSLFTWVKGENTARVFLRGLHHLYDLRYSPDGDCVAFDADVDGSGAGTYLSNVATGKVVKLSDAEFRAAWSPDGKQLGGATFESSSSGSKAWLVVLAASCDLLNR